MAKVFSDIVEGDIIYCVTGSLTTWEIMVRPYLVLQNIVKLSKTKGIDSRKCLCQILLIEDISKDRRKFKIGKTDLLSYRRYLVPYYSNRPIIVDRKYKVLWCAGKEVLEGLSNNILSGIISKPPKKFDKERNPIVLSVARGEIPLREDGKKMFHKRTYTSLMHRTIKCSRKEKKKLEKMKA